MALLESSLKGLAQPEPHSFILALLRPGVSVADVWKWSGPLRL